MTSFSSVVNSNGQPYWCDGHVFFTVSCKNEVTGTGYMYSKLFFFCVMCYV